MNRKIGILYRGPTIDGSYQVLSDGKSSLCLWQGELKKYFICSTIENILYQNI
jgi:hypothetical protein